MEAVYSAFNDKARRFAYVHFVTALLKQRKAAKKAEPDTNGRLKEIIGVLRKYNYDDGITPEITVTGADDPDSLLPAPLQNDPVFEPRHNIDTDNPEELAEEADRFLAANPRTL